MDIDRVLLNLSEYRRVPIDPRDVYFIEAIGDETLIRTRAARRLRDVRSLGEILPFFVTHGFLRVHRNHAVNLRRIREIRRRSKGEDWELKLAPPVNRVLPVSRGQIGRLLKALGA